MAMFYCRPCEPPLRGLLCVRLFGDIPFVSAKQVAACIYFWKSSIKNIYITFSGSLLGSLKEKIHMEHFTNSRLGSSNGGGTAQGATFGSP